MNNTKTDADYLFDKLDDVLDRSSWGRRNVYIRHRDGDFYIECEANDIRSLRTTLEAIAKHMNDTAISVSQDETEAIIDNLLEEYGEDINRARLPEKYVHR